MCKNKADCSKQIYENPRHMDKMYFVILNISYHRGNFKSTLRLDSYNQYSQHVILFTQYLHFSFLIFNESITKMWHHYKEAFQGLKYCQVIGHHQTFCSMTYHLKSKAGRHFHHITCISIICIKVLNMRYATKICRQYFIDFFDDEKV